MTRHTCAAKTCYNTSANKPLLKFFPFPINTESAKLWAKYSGRDDLLNLSTEVLSKKYFLCADHFEENLFQRPKFKNKFKQNENPTPTIFLNNLTEFIPKSIQNKISKIIIDKAVDKEECRDAEIDRNQNTEKENLRVVCRLCVYDISMDSSKDIFSSNNASLREAIDYFLPEKVSEQDGLPHHICGLCESKLLDCLEIVQSFLTADKCLKETFKSTKTENYGSLSDNVPESPSSFVHSETEVDGSDCINREFYTKKTMLKCSFCRAEFNTEGSLKSHVKQVHPLQRKYRYMQDKSHNVMVKCNKCEKVLLSTKLKSHISSNHIRKENQCEYCGIQYRTRLQLERHLLTHEITFCSYCGKEFNDIKKKRSHERTHTTNAGLLCEVCGKLVSDLRRLENHMKSHDKGGDFWCMCCTKSFKTELEREVHVASRTKKFSCPICSKMFHKKALVRQHLLSHSGVTPYSCFCGSSFNRQSNLTQHLKKHQDHHELTDKNVELFQCEICKKKLKSKVRLRWHLARHAGEKKPYDCEICGSKFSKLVYYKAHVRIHTGERPYACTFCSSTFRSMADLRQHEILHSEKYPHQCSQCNRQFKRLYSLIVHKRSHAGEQQYKCIICDAAFTKRMHLNKHMKTHTKDIEASNSSLPLEQVIPDNVETSVTNTVLFSVDDIAQLTLNNPDLMLSMSSIEL